MDKEQKKALEKLKQLKSTMKVTDLCELTGISRATLYTRLKKGNFKKPEIYLIKQI